MENKAFRVGVIGLGIGKHHAMGVQQTQGAMLYALCDTDEDRLHKVAAELGVDKVTTDYMELVNDPAIDALVVASPDPDHKEMIIAALEANKHVLAEKPLALTRKDCAVIMQAAEKSKGKLMVGQVARFTPSFIQAKQIIDSGAIGELTFVESEYAHDYSAIYAKGSWRTHPLRNGVVGGGCHAVDLLRWIAGDPSEVMAYGVHKTFADVTPYDDTHVAIMKFPSGVIGKVFISISCKRDYTMRSVFYGTKGTIIVDNTSPTMTVFKQDVFGDKDRHDMPITVPVKINNHNMAAEFKEFYEIARNSKEVEITGSEGANTIAVCQAIIDSAQSGKPVAPHYFP